MGTIIGVKIRTDSITDIKQPIIRKKTISIKRSRVVLVVI